MIFLLAALGVGLQADVVREGTWPKTKIPSGPDYLAQKAEVLEPTRKICYKQVGGRKLYLHVFDPAAAAVGIPRTAFVVFHGGGWNIGAPQRMYPFAAWAAEQGMVGISVEYRLLKSDPSMTVFSCVQDACAAIRHIRTHASELGIDPSRIIASGASAGGHLALSTLLEKPDDAHERSAVSCRPDGLILFSAVVNTSPDQSGQDKIGERWRELSPLHHVKPQMPPTLMFHGTADKLTAFSTARAFHDVMLSADNPCELIAVEGAPHIYMFKSESFYRSTLAHIGNFLRELGFVTTVVGF